MNKKNVLVLPGTLWQLPLVEKLKESGHRVLVVDPSPNAPCAKIADDHLQSDIFDIKRVIEYGQKNEVNAVLSDECDIAMNLVAELGHIFNAPTLDKESAALYTDKFLMREFCKTNGLKYPEYQLCKTAHEAIEFLNQLNAPIIIKPLDSNASHGVFKCKTKEDILNHFNESLSFSRIEKSVLAERYITGTEFTIDGVKTPKGHYTMCISEKKHFKHNANIANELFFTHNNPNFDYDKLRATNDEFVLKSNLTFGLTHAEYKYENGNFYLIEIAARGGGNMISSCIAQFMSGYDTYKYLVDCATGSITEGSFPFLEKYANRCAALKFFLTPDGGGIVKSIEGLDYLDEEPDIKHFRLNFKIGDHIKNAASDSARIGFYIVCSENIDRLQKVIDNVEQKFKIIY